MNEKFGVFKKVYSETKDHTRSMVVEKVKHENGYVTWFIYNNYEHKDSSGIITTLDGDKISIHNKKQLEALLELLKYLP